MGLKEGIIHLVLKYLAVPKPPIVDNSKVTIACVGDSITFGAGVRGDKTKTWEYILNDLLGDKYQVLNYGISGRTLLRDGDYPYTSEKFYSITHDIQANVYIIMLGSNDAKPYNWNEKNYEMQLREFLKSYIELPNEPRVIVMTPPQTYEDPRLGYVGFDIIPENIDGPIYNIVIEEACELGIQVIDLHEFTQNHQDWFDDGLHPNEVGNREIGKYIYDNIRNLV